MGTAGSDASDAGGPERPTDGRCGWRSDGSAAECVTDSRWLVK
jgi:hypothetical protein